MLNEFIKQAIEDHHFIKIESTSDNIHFLKGEGCITSIYNNLQNR